MTGYVKTFRSLADHDLWLAEPFTKGQAWMDLIMKCAFKESFFYVRGNKVSVSRGQVAMSQLTMADRWKWSRGKVKRFLNDLESEQMIVQQTGHLTTLVSLCNYEAYQGDGAAGGTAESTTDGQQTVQQTGSRRGTLEEGKEGKEGQEGIPTRELKFAKAMFAKIKETYPQTRQPNFNTWAKDIRLTIERDNRDPEELWRVFAWAHNDEFWSSNILSPSSLRKKYDQLAAKRGRSSCAGGMPWSSTTQRSITAMQGLDLNG